MNIERPKIKVPFEPIDVILEIISISIMTIMTIYCIIEYPDLPETVASHFNASGKPDNFSDKSFIWILPIIAICMYIGLFILNKFPHLHNYMVNITEVNALKNYRLSTRVVRFANVFCMILFMLITYEIIQAAKGQSPQILGVPFLIFTLIVPLFGVAFIIYYQKKINT